MPHAITESEIESAALEILSESGYEVICGPDIACDGKSPERANYSEVVLVKRLRNAIGKLNPKIPDEAKEEAIRKVLRVESQNIVANNRLFHRYLVDGIDISYRKKDGSIAGDKVWLFDFKNPDNNEFLALNQFTVVENNNNRRPDIILFVNGLPLVVIELKNPADENATIDTAFNQFETYKNQIPSLFTYNEILVISDGTEARAGTITAGREWFTPWKTVQGLKPTMPMSQSQLEVLLLGMFNKECLLELIRHFIVFEDDGKKVIKILGAYHQYNATCKALESTIKAIGGDRRAGVVWHTQGSGKSLTMVFYTGKIVLEPKMDNPTIVVLTDRNDLDGQLFGVFSRCKEILRQAPVQAESRDELKELLKVASGGIVFTTIQKFLPDEKGLKYPLLSERKNIIVIADEAHRSQYDFIDGFARHMRDALPNASFIGFTGTPIEKSDRSTPAVFGKHVDIYDIQQAVNDNVTVPIYFESRLAKLELKPEERPKIDTDFEYVTEGEEIEHKERLKSKWSRLEKVVGSERRIKKIAEDIVEHFETMTAILEGKGMIVCMSRRICVDIYNEMVRLRPEWHHKDDDKGTIKIVMTGSASDPVRWQEHIRNKERRKKVGDRLKDPEDLLKLLIVRDMFLTGYDAPPLHTMYVDKPMQGHGLMQAIARVNRVFKDKKGGLIVDYIGIAADLEKALREYTEGDKENTGIPQEEAVKIMKSRYEVVKDMYHGFDYQPFFVARPKEKMRIIPSAMEHILKQDDGKERYLKNVTMLTQAFALSVPHNEALEIKDEVGFFQVVRSAIAKNTVISEEEKEDLDSAIKQIISKAIVSDRVVDIFAAAGLKKPDISILSDEFLAEVRMLPHKNLAFETLRKLILEDINIRMKKNIVLGRSFKEMLEQTIRKYTNRTIETAKVIEELIELAKKMREENKRGDKLGLSDSEIAFYDALASNQSAIDVLGDKTLKTIAKELVEMIRKNVTIDWTIKESIQAKLRLMVKKILKKYHYPPDHQQKATDLVLEQAHLICKDWAESTA